MSGAGATSQLPGCPVTGRGTPHPTRSPESGSVPVGSGCPPPQRSARARTTPPVGFPPDIPFPAHGSFEAPGKCTPKFVHRLNVGLGARGTGRAPAVSPHTPPHLPASSPRRSDGVRGLSSPSRAQLDSPASRACDPEAQSPDGRCCWQGLGEPQHPPWGAQHREGLRDPPPGDRHRERSG